MSAVEGESGRELVKALRDSPCKVSISLVDRWAASTDRSGYVSPSAPDYVVYAETIEDVVWTMRLATEHRIPVVVRGAGTGLAAGASASIGEIVLDVSGMNRILRMDPDEQIAVVEPGVLNAEINRVAASFGLFYAPDPASTAICSIGGNIGTNAGGMKCAKYGVTRESILGLRVILADGRELRTGGVTLKGVAGYDLSRLMIGSEGTLGVVVEATLRLRPIPPETVTIAGFFPTFNDAARAASAVIAAHVQPSLLELVDASSLSAIDEAFDTDFRAQGGALLLAQIDGFSIASELDVLIEAISPFGARYEVGRDAEHADRLIAARRGIIPALERLGTVVIGDICVPRGRLAEAVSGLEGISRQTGVQLFTVAHAADGNLHPMFIEHNECPGHEERARDVLEQVFRLAVRLGGTLTGEHGVGLLKKPWISEELGSVSLEVHQAIKNALDPLGILNPGKAI